MMRTMEFQISETLFERIEQAARLAGVSTSDFIQQLLRRSLREWMIAELEQAEIEAYRRQPVMAGEFDLWESEQSWGEP
jgi:Arc/MetJ-type ribon-helix-helix transcriptional regulator